MKNKETPMSELSHNAIGKSHKESIATPFTHKYIIINRQIFIRKYVYVSFLVNLQF